MSQSPRPSSTSPAQTPSDPSTSHSAITPSPATGTSDPSPPEPKPTIKPVSSTTIHRIVSGQAITDLSSAVKELLDNSIDAGARTVTVRLYNQGIEKIIVEDDGSGVSLDSRPLLASKHCTSKLSTFDDLYEDGKKTILPLGFRGEALFCLANLSEGLSVITRAEGDAVCGQTLEFGRDGSLIGSKMTPRQVGTTVIVAGLFHSLPVRQADLKKRIKAQRGRLFQMIQGYAILSLGVRFHLLDVKNNKTERKLSTSLSCGSFEDTVSSVFGSKVLGGLMRVEVDMSSLVKDGGNDGKSVNGKGMKWSLSGLVSKPPGSVVGTPKKSSSSASSTTKDFQFFCLHHRPVDMPPKLSRVMSQVWKQSSSSSLKQKQRPSCVLCLKLPNSMMDVNLSPDKREVLLNEEASICAMFQEALEALWKQDTGKEVFENGAVERMSRDDDVKKRKGTGRNNLREEKERNGGDGTVSATKFQKWTASGQKLAKEPPPRKEDAGPKRSSAKNDPDDSDSEDDDFVRKQYQLHKKRRVSQPANAQTKLTVREEVAPDSSDSEDDDFVRKEYQLHKKRRVSQLANAQTKMTLREKVALLSSQTQTNTTPPRKSAVTHKEREERIAPIKSGTPTSERASKIKRSFSSFARKDSPFVSKRNARAVSVPTLPLEDDRAEVEIRKSGLNSKTVKSSEPDCDESNSSMTSNTPPSSARKHGKILFPDPLENCQSDVEISEVGTHLMMLKSNIPDGDQPKPSTTSITTPSSSRKKRIIQSNTLPSSKQSQEEEEENASPQPDQSRGSAEITTSPSPCKDNSSLSPSTSQTTTPIKAKGPQSDGNITWKNTFCNTQTITTQFHRARTHKKSIRQNLQHAKHARCTDSLTGNIQSTPLSVTETIGQPDTNNPSPPPTAPQNITLTKNSFSQMRIIGQFNLGFILATCPNHHLWILDQHACDEKFNFENLVQNTTLHEQTLLHPKRLELSAQEEHCILEHTAVFEKNGFRFSLDWNAEPRHRVALTAVPLSGTGGNAVQFGMEDVTALCAMLSGTGAERDTRGDGIVLGNNAVRRYAGSSSSRGGAAIARLPKAIAMFASRACRSSIMIGTPLTQVKMEGIVRKMRDVDQPWNCPHGRPTMRHVSDLLEGYLERDSLFQENKMVDLSRVSVLSEDENEGGEESGSLNVPMEDV